MVYSIGSGEYVNRQLVYALQMCLQPWLPWHASARCMNPATQASIGANGSVSSVYVSLDGNIQQLNCTFIPSGGKFYLCKKVKVMHDSTTKAQSDVKRHNEGPK